MSIKESINFSLELTGDGVSTSVTVLLSTAPISFYHLGQTLEPGFALTSLTPSTCAIFSCSDGTVVTSASLGLLGTMTITFATPIAAGTSPTVYGLFTF